MFSPHHEILNAGDTDPDLRVEDEELLPSELNTKNCGPFLDVNKDKVSVRYTGSGTHTNDVGSIQANRAVPNQRLLYYYEISVKDRGEKGKIGIGFTDKHFKMSRQPGWENNSYGYHGDDGNLYNGCGRGESYGPTFTTNDIVGAGINFATQEMFFTKNGKFLGTACKDVRGELFPTIGLHSPSERVEVNFGQRPFLFDIEAMVQEERERRHREVEGIPLPLSISHRLVRNYFLYYGYEETLTALDAASGGAFPPLPAGSPSTSRASEQNGSAAPQVAISFALDHRKTLQQLIRNGEVEAAMSKLREWYPQILQEPQSNVSFLLSTQTFIEMVKAGDLDSAVLYARNMLSHFRGTSPERDNHLQRCLALLAYENPADSPVGPLLHSHQREVVADSVNAAVLSTAVTDGPLPESALERLLKQLTLCHMEKRVLEGGQGEVFRLHRILQGGKDGGW
eukprot:TRINITY_DN15383_c0_g2_i1.p1 TRINITY_DN15383_c0_g2~~TRINITY_DN15383_c0_g2_i1.p1  ORF type:complete len:454 (-),score=74.96 TRINITY_DN15383_c0_g2_i1:379-1740(-)